MTARCRTTGSDLPVEGVTALDHTADVGIEIRSDDLAGLLEGALRGMDWLLREASPPEPLERRSLRLTAPDPATLLRACLREALLWHESDGFAPARLETTTVSSTELDGEIVGSVAEGRPVREIKGVTLHELAAEQVNDGWYGRVIFDV